MNFTSPAVLWAIPAAAAPLILHLISLRRARRLLFGDLSLLRQIHARALPRTRLRSWLLLAARCLLILALVLAYAGPVLESPTGGGAPKGLELVVLLDSSYSMGGLHQGKSRFTRAVEAASGLLRGLKDSDRVSVGVFSEEIEAPSGKLQWVSHDEALKSLSEARVGFKGTDYDKALRAASDLFGRTEPEGRRIVLLLSDGARHGFPASGKLPRGGPEVTVLGLSWPEAGMNAYLSGGGPSSRSTLRSPRLMVRVTSDAKEKARSLVEVFLEGRRVAGTPVTLMPERVETLDFPLPSTPPIGQGLGTAAWAGSLRLRADALKVDDVFFYSFKHERSSRVLFLYGSPDFLELRRGGYFLKELCGSGDSSLLRFECEFAELGRFADVRLSDYSAVVLADFKAVASGRAASLQAYVKRGGGLWVLPGPATAADGFKNLNTWLPARVGPASASFDPFGLSLGPDMSRWKGFELDRVSVRRSHRLRLTPGSKVHLTNVRGEPLLVSGALGRGRIMVWASSLDVSWSNIGVKPVFAAWVQHILDVVAPSGPGGAKSLNIGVGGKIVREWGRREAVPSRVSIRSPGGRRTTLWVKDRKIEYSRTQTPGLYTVKEEGIAGKSSVYAVNVDRTRESDLTPAAEPPWRTLGVETLQEDWRLVLYGRRIRAPLVAFAILMMILEMFLSLPWAWRPRKAGILSSDPPGVHSRTLTGVKSLVLALFLSTGLVHYAAASEGPPSASVGDRFVWTQLRIGDHSDPYPNVWSDAVALFAKATSVLTHPARRVISLKDPDLFYSPLVILAGRRAPPELDVEELRNLRHYLSGGGLLWIEDTSGTVTSSFDRWVKRLLPKVVPGAELKSLPPDHVVYRTFFLLRGPAGRVMVRGSLEGIERSGMLAVIYSRNDILGVWAKDALGRSIYRCTPGGETQRQNARKLTLNILMYSLTGSYKSDAVHQPGIMSRLRMGVP